MNARFSDYSTHASVPGAWWWNHREVPCLRSRGGTHLVAIGLSNLDDNRFPNAYYGGVIDDFGTLIRVGPEAA